MPRPLRLEVFSTAPRRQNEPAPQMVPADAVEEARLEAFEKGYKAGWDDAVAAQEDEAQRLSANVGRNLQALSFTYHEARGHLLHGLGPLLDGICARILPETARAALGGIVREALEPLAEEALDRPVTLVLTPEARPLVEAALAQAAAPPVAFVEEPSLAPGQLHLRWDGGEQRIDLDAAVAEIGAAVTAWFAEATGAEAPEAGAPEAAVPEAAVPEAGAPEDGAPEDGAPGFAPAKTAATTEPAAAPEAAAPLPDLPTEEMRRHG